MAGNRERQHQHHLASMTSTSSTGTYIKPTRYALTHTCIHTYVHTYLLTYIHTCIGSLGLHSPSEYTYTVLCPRIYTCVFPSIQFRINTFIHTHIYIHTYIHTHVYLYIHIHAGNMIHIHQYL